MALRTAVAALFDARALGTTVLGTTVLGAAVLRAAVRGAAVRPFLRVSFCRTLAMMVENCIKALFARRVRTCAIFCRLRESSAGARCARVRSVSASRRSAVAVFNAAFASRILPLKNGVNQNRPPPRRVRRWLRGNARRRRLVRAGRENASFLSLRLGLLEYLRWEGI